MVAFRYFLYLGSGEDDYYIMGNIYELVLAGERLMNRIGYSQCIRGNHDHHLGRIGKKGYILLLRLVTCTPLWPLAGACFVRVQNCRID